MKIANAQGRAAGWLSLGAAPTFALMAALTIVADHGAPEMLCSAAPHASALDGMVPMYVLMSVFHVAPWLKLVAGWESGVLRSCRLVIGHAAALTASIALTTSR